MAALALAIPTVVQQGLVRAVAEAQVFCLKLVHEALEAVGRSLAPAAFCTALWVAHFPF